MSIPAPDRYPTHTYQKIPSDSDRTKPSLIDANRVLTITFGNLGKKISDTHRVKLISQPRGSDVTMEDIFFGKRGS